MPANRQSKETPGPPQPSATPAKPFDVLISALENAATSILLTDSAGAIVWASPAFSVLTGYSLQEVAGTNPPAVNSGWHPPKLFPEIWQTALAGRSWSGRAWNQRKQGSTYLEDTTITPIRNGSGAISHFLVLQQEISSSSQFEQAILSDPAYHQPANESGRGVSEWSELEEQLRRAQKMEAVGQLASGAAHDFNNLLTVINGYSDLLLSRNEPAESSRRYIRLIRDAGERAATLAARLLAFSRSKGQESTIVDLNDVVADMSALLRRLLPSNIQFIHTLEPRLDAVVADVGLIEQVLMNLVVNARDAMAAGGKIRLETANEQTSAGIDAGPHGIPPGRYVVLTVADTGVGMDESTKARMFEPFFTTKPAGVGTGLGLSTVYRIVKQSSGWISIRSEQGKGTSVSVYLPAAPGKTVTPAVAARLAPERGSGTILLVDDNAEVLHFAANSLNNLGYAVLSASSGEEATNWARNYEDAIDLLIIDLVLPDKNGRDIAERLTALRPGLAVLFVSGYPHHPTIKEDVPRTGPEFLPKPFTGDSLGLRVQQVLRQRYCRRLLVIDDDPAMIAFARGVLTEAGFEVRTAQNGLGAVDCVREHAIDLVITDLIMPESEGLETIRHLRQEFPELPIIATSGAFQGQFLLHALKFGVQAVLPKPFTAVNLLEMVRRTLGIGARRAGN